MVEGSEVWWASRYPRSENPDLGHRIIYEWFRSVSGKLRAEVSLRRF
jgi:hypothetical protein